MKRNLIFLGYNRIVDLIISEVKFEKLQIVIISDSNQLAKCTRKHSEVIYLISSKQELKKNINKYYSGDEDLIISVGCPWILSQSNLNQFNNRVLNLHGTHLPMYRGGTLFTWYILNRRKTGMCALHNMTVEIDKGGVVAWEEYLIPTHCRKPIDLIGVYEEQNISFLKSIIGDWQMNIAHLADFTVTQQPEYLSSYWPRLLAKEHSWINWDWKGDQIETFICAFDDPYSGANSRWREFEIRIKDAVFQPGSSGFHPFQHGMVFRKNKDWVTIAVSGGELIVSTILNQQNENIIDNIKVGERIYSFPNDLINQYTYVKKTDEGLKPIKYW